MNLTFLFPLLFQLSSGSFSVLSISIAADLSTLLCYFTRFPSLNLKNFSPQNQKRRSQTQSDIFGVSCLS